MCAGYPASWPVSAPFKAACCCPSRPVAKYDGQRCYLGVSVRLWLPSICCTDTDAPPASIVSLLSTPTHSQRVDWKRPGGHKVFCERNQSTYNAMHSKGEDQQKATMSWTQFESTSPAESMEVIMQIGMACFEGVKAVAQDLFKTYVV